MWGESYDQDVEARRHHRARISFHSLVLFEAAGVFGQWLANWYRT